MKKRSNSLFESLKKMRSTGSGNPVYAGRRLGDGGKGHGDDQ